MYYSEDNKSINLKTSTIVLCPPLRSVPVFSVSSGMLSYRIGRLFWKLIN